MLKSFIILSSARTGSNFLVSLLNSTFPKVQCLGEIYKQDFVPSRFEEPILALACNSDNSNFLAQTSSKKYHLLKKVVNADGKIFGSKLFIYHARDEKEGSIWEQLDNEDIPVIGLIRSNMLEQFVSLKNAELSGEWMTVADGSFNDQRQLTLDKSELDAFFRTQEKYSLEIQRIATLAGGLVLEYSNLVEDTVTSAKKCAEFLGLAIDTPVRSLVKKQSARSPKEKIENYLELRSHYEGTAYESFFT